MGFMGYSFLITILAVWTLSVFILLPRILREQIQLTATSLHLSASAVGNWLNVPPTVFRWKIWNERKSTSVRSTVLWLPFIRSKTSLEWTNVRGVPSKSVKVSWLVTVTPFKVAV